MSASASARPTLFDVAAAGLTGHAVAAAPTAGAAAGQTQLQAPPPGCPPMWTQATPPPNPALGCVPTFIASAVRGADGPPAPGSCPRGWKRASPPLNLALGVRAGLHRERGHNPLIGQRWRTRAVRMVRAARRRGVPTGRARG